jgi:prevent-host-death family protein
MMPRLTATEAARNFSDVLNRVAGGEEVEVVRSGAPVAVIVPPRVRLVSAERFRELVAAAPPVDEDFARDIAGLRDSVGPPRDPWPS